MSKWPRVPLGELLAPVSRPEAVDPKKTYRILGAHWYAHGLYTKETLSGAEIRAPRVFRIEKGDFVYNRLFAWKGSFAVATEENHVCYVSNEFPSFEAKDNRIDLNFLWKYFSRETAWTEALGFSTGGTPTSRNRLKEEAFFKLTIPLPPLGEQRRLVERIDALAGKINAVHSATTDIDKQNQLLLSATFRQMIQKSPLLPLGDIAPLTRRPAKIDPLQEYPRVSVRSFGRGTFHNPPLKGSEITWEKPHLVKADDVLISNIKAWEGAIAVAKPEDDGRYGSHRYLTYVPVPGIATARFVCFFLLSPEGLYEVGEASPGSADRNRTTSAKALLKIPVPLPSYEQQIWFGQLYDKVENIRQLQAEASAGRIAMLPAILDRAFRGEL